MIEPDGVKEINFTESLRKYKDLFCKPMICIESDRR